MMKEYFRFSDGDNSDIWSEAVVTMIALEYDDITIYKYLRNWISAIWINPNRRFVSSYKEIIWICIEDAIKYKSQRFHDIIKSKFDELLP